MLSGHQLLGIGLLFNRLSEQFINIVPHQEVTVLGECRMISNRIIHAQPEKPTKHQVVVRALDQLAFEADGKEYL